MREITYGDQHHTTPWCFRTADGEFVDHRWTVREGRCTRCGELRRNIPTREGGRR